MTNEELDDRMAELLVGYNVLPATTLATARAFQASRRGTLVGALMELHLVPKDTIGALLQELTGVRAVDPTLLTVYPDFVERTNLLVPPELVAQLLVFPVQMEVNTLHLCMINPTDGSTGRTLEAVSGCRVAPLVATETAIAGAIEKHYAKYLPSPVARLVGDEAAGAARAAYTRLLDAPFDTYLQPAVALINRNRDQLARDPKALEQMVRDPYVIRLVQQIVCRAVESGASDIHVEPTGKELRVRARVDGAMRTMHTLPSNATGPVVSRLKAMAELPLEPSRTPLDARIGYDLVLGRGIDLRFSAVPSVVGEKIVLRVLDRTRERRQLSDLGVDEETRAQIEEAADLPNGLLLVTGPTGSGKSSTLYALLDRLNGDDLCILTAEDPVESRIVGVTQVQCSESADLSYATALRSFLRQDPDVIMVGEIRDAETADVALKAALTGHLVMSTLHTNDAPGAVLRLLNMGLEPFIVASSLRLVLAQRLVRRLCAKCKRPADPASVDTILRRVSPASQRMLRSGQVFEPVGCPACLGSGYRGRVGIFEVLRVNDAMEELVISRRSVAEIRATARRDGMRTLREAGWRKVALGDTSIAEVLEHTIADAEEQASGAEIGENSVRA